MAASAQLDHFTNSEIAIALADEGVPVRAIARSIKTPGEDVYELLRDAVEAGRLFELPRDDWPPKTKRSQRAQTQNTVLSRDDEALRMGCSSRFKMTRLQAAVFVALLRRPELSKEHIHNAIEAIRPQANAPTDLKMVDVVICHIRKKLKIIDKEFNIVTVWGIGYSLLPATREACIALLTEHFSSIEQQASSPAPVMEVLAA
jgi:DNA-binding response OmpR family regulator